MADLPALDRIEQASFDGDCVSRRSFRHFLTRGQALILVDRAHDGALRGYIALLFRARTSVARVYTIATDAAYRGMGVAAALVTAAEAEALARGCTRLRLEIRPDNQASQALFHACGYRVFGSYADYYEDGADALRLEKPLLT
ncbi:GNAT family N-acetyltransferase [Oxalobacteraceae bacterium]|nr:GNAT family N-acetyltransferase [Oxalobacteraceae bacterium]